jgi:hypothetical protein
MGRFFHGGPLKGVVPETVCHDPTEAKIEIMTTKPLTNRLLIRYLNERGIAAVTARPFVKEARYTVNGSYNQRGKPFFALAFPNNAGGYELRNKYFKGASSKDISLVQASGSGNDMAIFEGFMDFLSAVTWLTFPRFSRRKEERIVP